MGRITLKQAAQWCGGKIDEKYADVSFFGASNDSRLIGKDELFVVLQGARDGHAFIPAALEQGAAAVLCSRCDGDYPAIVVEDTRIALGQIAKQERLRLGCTVVGITGSVGKSTTKEMTAAILETTFRTGKTPVNHNNDIGMPMGILALPEDTQVAVLEMGMNHFREMAYLSSIAQPDIAVIINIGSMHIEHLGSMRGVLQAKLEILEGLKPEGTAVFNGDDALLWSADRKPGVQTTFFGVENPLCAVLGSDVQTRKGGSRFHVEGCGSSFDVELNVEGRHFVNDALAAVTVALRLGVKPEKIREALYSFRNMAGRQEILQAKGCTIISDCYNAGPESMVASLEVLGSQEGRRIAVLGDMLELGVCTQAEHFRIGRIAAEKADLILAYGPNSRRIVSGAVTGGKSGGKAQNYETHGELAAALKRVARPGDVILFKGSHGMHLEKVLEQFLQDER